MTISGKQVAGVVVGALALFGGLPAILGFFAEGDGRDRLDLAARPDAVKAPVRQLLRDLQGAATHDARTGYARLLEETMTLREASRVQARITADGRYPLDEQMRWDPVVWTNARGADGEGLGFEVQREGSGDDAVVVPTTPLAVRYGQRGAA